MDTATRDFVRQRAEDRCEYCLIHQEHAETVHHIEHITARQHGGSDSPENLALACIHTGIDPDSGRLVPLFNPRRDPWADHFALHGAYIVGLTPTGRTTVYVLAMNASHRLNVRTELIAQGLYP